MEDWDYAALSKSAKAMGGPEKYVDFLESTSRNAGKMEMLPWIGVAAAGASLLTIAGMKIVSYFKLRKIADTREIELAKKKIVDGINEYDASHSDEEGGEEDER